MGEKRNACRILVQKLEGKKPPRKHRCRSKANIKMYLRETGWVLFTAQIWFRIGTSGGLS
jgi:hypothetical protein